MSDSSKKISLNGLFKEYYDHHFLSAHLKENPFLSLNLTERIIKEQTKELLENILDE